MAGNSMEDRKYLQIMSNYSAEYITKQLSFYSSLRSQRPLRICLGLMPR